MAEAVRDARAVYGDEWVVRVLVDATVGHTARTHIQVYILVRICAHNQVYVLHTYIHTYIYLYTNI